MGVPSNAVSKNQSNSAREVLLLLDEQMAGPLHDRLRRAVRAAIASGRLPAGSTLPPSRTLAADLGCSRWVVTEAYAQLAAEGYLESRAGSATRVRSSAGSAATRTAPLAPLPPLPRFDFAPGLPDLRAFPRQHWSAAVHRVGLRAPHPDFGHLEPAGHRDLRRTLAQHLVRSRGAAVTPNDTTICAGTTDAVTRIARALRACGVTHVAVEEPGWPGTRKAINDAGLVPVPIDVDGDGLQVDPLRTQPRIQAVVVAPSHQFPTGTVLAPTRRAELIAWADAVDGIILEDDKDADFRYDRRPVAAMQGMAPARVALLGSLSKTLSPALRIGWFTVPPRWATAIRTANPMELPPPVLDQLAFAALLENGVYDRHLRASRRRYRTRRDSLMAELSQKLPSARVSGAAAGLHLLLHLEDADAADVVALAARDGVRVGNLADYHTATEPAESTLVVGYGNLADSGINEAVDRLARAIERVTAMHV
ncbi:PLP-dependent aminotransferase family protein [Dactylosporangium sucinum]|uniref:GntR family transcriptional regulator n=1 Tax=Dactylosporangium sucinum TaxID=1424081 RepID=A0A917UC79_9ACTN|nr:PLP-dependent aminotransferase family protein [Dactylosporangium sucinum]GGM71397.1 GntR family transcriptional regulator [Dactylosporangium sucinum]